MSSIAVSGAQIVAVETPALGDRSYLAHDGSSALVIDPQRDIDRILAEAGKLGVTIRHVFETHLHNDYVTGGLALARAAGAAYHVNAADPVAFDRAGVTDGDLIEVSPLVRVRALATPGHTFTHLSYALEAAGQPVAVFTGGSLLYGSTGRPDLLGAEHAAELARAQHASAHRLAELLPDEAGVYPTHGFGSFCSATQTQGGASTIGREKRINPALTADEETFVTRLLAGLDAYPAYYAHMAPANAAGPASPDLSPPRRADAAELREAVRAGEWVVDLRTRTAFAAGHVAGSLSFALEDGIATYLGWLIPWGTPLTLLGEDAQQVAGAQRELARIGIDRPRAAATGRPQEWAGGQPLAQLPARPVRRPGGGQPSPAGRTAGRTADRGMGAVASQGCGAYPAARPACAAGRGPGRPGLGVLRRRAPRRDRRLGPGRRGPRCRGGRRLLRAGRQRGSSAGRRDA